MRCIECDAAEVSERPERTTQGYRRFRCRACGKQFNERSGGILNRAQYPSDVIALVVFWRLRYKLSLRDLSEMFLIRGIAFSYEAVRDWQTKLSPILIDNLRRRRRRSFDRPKPSPGSRPRVSRRMVTTVIHARSGPSWPKV
jgi:transposase-like protein